MDLDQASTKTFEPEWLKTKKHTPPLKYTRSKSSPLLPLTPGSQNAQQQQEQQKDKNVFNMLKERNSWDRNFPTLNTTTRKPPPNANGQTAHRRNNSMSSAATISSSSSTSSSMHNSWNTSNVVNITAPKEKTVVPSSPERNSPSEDELHHVKGLIPTAAKVTRKPELVNTKKGNLDQLLRKASSAPTLPIHPAYAENYAKLMAERRFKEKIVLSSEHKPGHVMLHRNEFFKGIINKKAQQQLEKPPEPKPSAETSSGSENTKIETNSGEVNEKSSENTSTPTASNENETNKEEKVQSVESNGTCKSSEPELKVDESLAAPSSSLQVVVDSESVSTNGTTRRSSPILSIEAEEKFLRFLGWVSEEEEEVPELTDEEKEEARKKIMEMKGARRSRSHQTLDVASIRRWQEAKFHNSPISCNE